MYNQVILDQRAFADSLPDKDLEINRISLYYFLFLCVDEIHAFTVMLNISFIQSNQNCFYFRVRNITWGIKQHEKNNQTTRPIWQHRWPQGPHGISQQTSDHEWAFSNLGAMLGIELAFDLCLVVFEILALFLCSSIAF